MSKISIGIWVLALLSVVVLGVWQWEWDASWLETWIEDHLLLGALIYVIALAVSVVLLPFSSLPLLPLAARVYDIWLTTLLSTAGWWIGALVAFQIARYGRRYLARITSLDTLDRIEQKIPSDIGFFGIVILRMILPVDVVSFALGLLKRLPFSTYAIASLIGIVPFAAVYAYAGGELESGRLVSFFLAILGMAIAVLTVRQLWKRYGG